ncbi:MAG: hypothetical protein ABGY72_19650, partial [bacterium]
MRMSLRRCSALLAVLVLGGGAQSGGVGVAWAQGPDSTVTFNRDVRPILAEGCYNCHGPNAPTRQDGLRLDIPEGPLADRGRYGGPVIVP